MTALFLSPHNDDETLFGAYSICKEHEEGGVHVVTVLQSCVQERRGTGITAAIREKETENAILELLGADGVWEQWSRRCSDFEPEWDHVTAELKFTLRDPCASYERVYAPFNYGIDGGGQKQHDIIGRLAVKVCEPLGIPVVGYHTYTNGRGRMEGIPVEPKPEWIRKKLLALACYESQIMEPSTGHHFEQALHEWIAADATELI